MVITSEVPRALEMNVYISSESRELALAYKLCPLWDSTPNLNDKCYDTLLVVATELLSDLVMSLKLHLKVTFSHTGTLIRNSSNPFPIISRTQSSPAVISDRVVATYRKSYTKYFLSSFISETSTLIPFHFHVSVLQFYMYHVLFT